MPLDTFALGESLQQTFSISQLNRKVKDLLEIHFPLIWVEGEISNFNRPSSGHWYFTLKDEHAQVSCAMFKRRSQLVKFDPKIGDHLKVRAHVSLYEGRGDYQLIIEHMEQAGFGLLQKRFEELKNKLREEGLFDAGFKKPIPSPATHLAVVTSSSGAAVRDVLAVLKRRFPSMPVTIVPSPVQGDDAPQKLIDAIKTADTHPEFDVILLCRGGGSIEDLWAFNSEALARQIFSCNTPLVCAVGHEVDFTIADFVADLRAPTPSAAAELVSLDRTELLEKLGNYRSHLQRRISELIVRHANQLKHLKQRLKHPRDTIEQWYQRLDQLEIRLNQGLERHIRDKALRLALVREKLLKSSPGFQIEIQRQRLDDLGRQLTGNLKRLLTNKRQHYQHATSALDLVSPIATLNRGYSIARDTNGRVVRSVDKVKLGDRLRLVFSDGELESTIDKKLLK